jgi:hypothetical protein
MPDNSIWLVARKNTGVRIYVDYQRDPTQPAIANLTGSLIVNTGSSTVTLSPINSGGSIQPRPDSNINMANANHTLNFMIPSALSVGEITITCRVWDQADASQRPSPTLIRTLTFIPVQPLSLFLVGVGYNAVTPNVAAPTQAAISASLSQLTKTYPVGDIIQTGYTTLAFSETVTGNLAKGCGSGLNHLLDWLNDLRGSSPDTGQSACWSSFNSGQQHRRLRAPIRESCRGFRGYAWRCTARDRSRPGSPTRALLGFSLHPAPC